MPKLDAIVLGLGGMGSAALYHLAQRGQRVLGIEKFSLVHSRGSSHGQTRIIRKAYFEHADYVPLLHRAYELWDELDRTAAAADPGSPKLFERCGLLLVGPPDGPILSGVRSVRALHGLEIEDVDGPALVRRFPQFRYGGGKYGLFEPDAGFLRVEECVYAHLAAAKAHGATIIAEDPVLEWSSDGQTARVRIAGGTFEAASLVICGGAWATQILSDLKLPLTVRRTVQFWFEPHDARLRFDNGCPTFGFDTPHGFFYGFPALPMDDSMLLKAAQHVGGEVVGDPDRLDRALHLADFSPMQSFLVDHLPGVAPAPRRHSACMYTMTPDEHFIIDLHPEHANVCFAAGFSGHGFKFATVIGEVLADLCVAGDTRAPIGFLRLDRLRSRESG